jgi:hypothetical protein
MSSEIPVHAPRLWSLAAIVALALVLVAAGVELDENWARLQAMPREARARLVENLQKFDLVLTSEKQKELRDLDGRIFALPPEKRTEFLAAMRRYHNWLGKLPQNRRDEVLSVAPADRMTAIRKLAAQQHPVPRADTPRFLRINDPGEFSPLELAAIFKIWHALSPVERQQLEHVPLGPTRYAALFKLGDAREIPREIKPDDFDPARWITRIEKAKTPLPAKQSIEQLPKKQQQRWAQIVRRQAINLYFVENAPAPVRSERLAQFAATFPAWVEATFQSYAPDEARRRLTIVYRLVFPPGTEIKPVPPPSAAASAGKTQPPQPGPASRGQSSPAGRVSNPF